MRRTILVCLSLVLVGCTDTAEVSDSQTLQITLNKTNHTDEVATLHTQASLEFTGVLNETVVFDDILGDLVAVKGVGFDVYEKPRSQTLMVLTSWWAGQGEEIVVSRSLDTNILTVSQRYGDEEGTCTDPEVLATFTLPDNIRITMDGISEGAVEQSSLRFCYEGQTASEGQTQSRSQSS